MKTRSSDVQSPPAPALLSRLAEKAWSLAYDIPDLTFIQPPDPVREMTTLASDRKPWIIIRQAVSQELCIKAVEELRESPPTPHNHPSFLQYKPTATCITIADLNHEVHAKQHGRIAGFLLTPCRSSKAKFRNLELTPHVLL